MPEPVDHDRLARQAVYRIPARPCCDADDLMQEARIAAWLARANPDEALIVVRARRRAIDALRRLYGDERHPRPECVPLSHDNTGEWDDVDYDVADRYGLRGRMAAIATGLAAGRTKADVAEYLGVTPGRVSQLLHELRALIGED